MKKTICTVRPSFLSLCTKERVKLWSGVFFNQIMTSSGWNWKWRESQSFALYETPSLYCGGNCYLSLISHASLISYQNKKRHVPVYGMCYAELVLLRTVVLYIMQGSLLWRYKIPCAAEYIPSITALISTANKQMVSKPQFYAAAWI